MVITGLTQRHLTERQVARERRFCCSIGNGYPEIATLSKNIASNLTIWTGQSADPLVWPVFVKPEAAALRAPWRMWQNGGVAVTRPEHETDIFLKRIN